MRNSKAALRFPLIGLIETSLSTIGRSFRVCTMYADQTSSLCPKRGGTSSWPVLTSQIRIEWSREPETTRRPFDERATEYTGARCPFEALSVLELMSGSLKSPATVFHMIEVDGSDDRADK